MKNIGLIGFSKENFNYLTKKFKNTKFINLKDLNSRSLKDITAIVAFNFEKINKFILSQSFTSLKKLEWIHVPVAGVNDYIHLIDSMKFNLTCSKKINDINVAEHTVGLFLFLSRQIKFSQEIGDLKKLKRPVELNNKKLLIVGYGAIGKKVASVLKKMGVKIDAINSRGVHQKSFSIDNFFELKDLSKIVGKYQLILITIALTDLTKGIINKKIFNNLSKNVILINVSRSEVMNEDDFINYIKTKSFYGIGVDVLKSKNLKKIFKKTKHKNIVYTNHSAGLTDNHDRRLKLIADNILRYVSNKQLLNKVNFKKKY